MVGADDGKEGGRGLGSKWEVMVGGYSWWLVGGGRSCKWEENGEGAAGGI